MLKTTIVILLVLVSTATSDIFGEIKHQNPWPVKIPTQEELYGRPQIGGPEDNPPPVAFEKKEKEPESECPDGLKTDDGLCIKGTSTHSTQETSSANLIGFPVAVEILQLVITFYFY
ncbi:hypothetical protein CRE_14481 [Caenorhabditis remanei]|uniref:Uncharacterized protein n=1 Tax=Caenorhabditis remanei TaxID=31234 RepID=E3M957_CAERE|nr:hypothetical protein CRE_14481 [Caenorhabditis remanei]